MKLLVDKTKTERGYSATSRLITSVMYTLSCTYPLNGRFVNSNEWNDPGKNFGIPPLTQICITRLPAFDRDHHVHWGKMYETENVDIEWHGACTCHSRTAWW
jgi:proteasome activator subunit 4